MIRYFEGSTEKIATQKVVDIVKSSQSLDDEDVLIFSDLDEMISRGALHHLRHCQLHSDVLSVAITMPMGNLDKAFITDFPVPGKPHSFGRATVVKWKLIGSGAHQGGRGVPQADGFHVTGGVHLTAFSYVAFVLLKDLTATEYTGSADVSFLQNLNLTQIDQYQMGKI